MNKLVAVAVFSVAGGGSYYWMNGLGDVTPMKISCVISSTRNGLHE